VTLIPIPDRSNNQYLIRRYVCLFTLFALLASCGGGNQKKDPELIVQARRLASLGSDWYQRGCYPRAERYFRETLEASRLLDDLPGMLRANNNLGATLLALGRFEEAGTALQRAMELNQSVNSTAEASLILGNLAALAFRTGRTDQAENFWRLAVKKAEEDEQRTGLILHLNNLGMLLRTEKRLDQAEAVLLRAHELALRDERKGSLAGTSLQLGLLAQAGGDLAKAEEHLLSALELDKETVNPLGVAYDLEKLGLLYQERKSWVNAARMLDRAIFMRGAMGQKEKVVQIYKLLETNQARGGWPESLLPYQDLLDRDLDPGESMLCE
jgi:tetratricopeptide (TPR) repeat protein